MRHLLADNTAPEFNRLDDAQVLLQESSPLLQQESDLKVYADGGATSAAAEERAVNEVDVENADKTEVKSWSV